MIHHQKLIVVMPAYNSERTIEKVFARFSSPVRSWIDEFIVVNDGSTDKTEDKVRSLIKQYPNITLITHEINKGYAQAWKSGFRAALAHGADIAALIHSDGQYAPEELERLLQPLIKNERDIVQGGRILGGKALQGGMPLYKYITIRFASFFENLIYGMNLHEFHSGYMLYSRRALETIPFERLSNTFYIDAEMLFTAHSKRLRIQSLPIPTHYEKGIKSNIKRFEYVCQVISIMIKKLRGGYDFRDNERKFKNHESPSK